MEDRTYRTYADQVMPLHVRCIGLSGSVLFDVRVTPDAPVRTSIETNVRNPWQSGTTLYVAVSDGVPFCALFAALPGHRTVNEPHTTYVTDHKDASVSTYYCEMLA